MGLNDTPLAERLHIGFFGVRNAGKSSLVNALTGQDASVVSDVAGTTTDPVKKTMELLPLGPVVIIDTPGLDDEGQLGQLRVERTKKILSETDIAVLVVDSAKGASRYEEELAALFRERQIPFLIAQNKCDLIKMPDKNADMSKSTSDKNAPMSQSAVDNKNAGSEIQISKSSKTKFGESGTVYVSCVNKDGIEQLKNELGKLSPVRERAKGHLASDLVSIGDVVVLVIPIDSAAPKGRLILPQQQVIRDLLDAGVSVMCTRDSELEDTLAKLKNPPSLVITDSQVFAKVAKIVDDSVPLTSFSILMARYKGTLPIQIEGAKYIDRLRDGDRVLISEGCTHHRQCDDIGTVKLPRLIRSRSGADIVFETSSGDTPTQYSNTLCSIL